MSLRILHVLDHSLPLHSGYTFRTLAILREQRRKGWETLQLTSSKHYGATAGEEEIDGFRFYRTLVAERGWRRWPIAAQWAVIHDTQRRLEEVIAAVRPNLVHAHSPCLNGIAAVRAARKFDLPVVYEMRASWEDAAVDHGTTSEGSLRYRVSRALETWTLRHADAVTTICEGLRRDILARGLPASKVTVIPNAVDPDQFRIIEARDAALERGLGLQGAYTLGFVGSFYGYEGLDTLLDALPLVLRRCPAAHLLLVGGGPEEARLRSQSQRLGLADKVHFAGRVPHGDVPRYYSVIDLLVYARKSIRLTENVTPLKPLEAMAQGRLFVASNVGGHRELIRDGETGVLFEPDRPEALAGAVERVWHDPQLKESMRKAGRHYVDSERNWRSSVARYESVYESVLHGARRR